MIATRLTRTLELRHPIVSAPMAFAGGGALAAAVTRAGGLGLIGGGYGDPGWLQEQFAAAAGKRVGVGFITWSLRKSPSLLTDVLKHRPAAVMLSFGDPRPYIDEIRAAGAAMCCQCQDIGARDGRSRCRRRPWWRRVRRPAGTAPRAAR
jgi:nitronate monooxygenase